MCVRERERDRERVCAQVHVLVYSAMHDRVCILLLECCRVLMTIYILRSLVSITSILTVGCVRVYMCVCVCVCAYVTEAACVRSRVYFDL